MNYYDDEMLEYFWKDNDNQDGTYFSSYEKSIQINDEDFEDAYDMELEEKKWKAVLYLRLHKELLKKQAYQKAYNYIIDEYIREFEYLVNDKHKVTITEKDREYENLVIDIEIKKLGEKRISEYEADALYIVDFITDLTSD